MARVRVRVGDRVRISLRLTLILTLTLILNNDYTTLLISRLYCNIYTSLILQHRAPRLNDIVHMLPPGEWK